MSVCSQEGPRSKSGGAPLLKRLVRRAGIVAPHPFIVKWHVFVHRPLLRGVLRFHGWGRIVYEAWCLGWLSRAQLQALDQYYYETSNMYRNDHYTRQGLFAPEAALVDRYVAPGARVFVAGAGGGREVYALHRRGHVVRGCECHPLLAEYGNAFLRRHGAPEAIVRTLRDHLPTPHERYDVVMLGWSVYSLIQGTAQRVAFLREVSAYLADGGILLISCMRFANVPVHMRRVCAIGNIFRRMRCLPLLDPGDAFGDNYTHWFTDSELRAELARAGFALLDAQPSAQQGFFAAVAVDAIHDTSRRWEPVDAAAA